MIFVKDGHITALRWTLILSTLAQAFRMSLVLLRGCQADIRI